MDNEFFFSFAESLDEPVLMADARDGSHIWSSARFNVMADASGKKEIDALLNLLLSNRQLDNFAGLRPGDVPPCKVLPVALHQWTGNVHVHWWNWDEKSVLTAVFRQEKTMAAERRRQALHRLGESKDIDSGDFGAAARIITETAAKTMYANWVSLWRLDRMKNQFINEVIYNLESGFHSRLNSFPAEKYGRYMEILRAKRCVVIHDTRTDNILPGLTNNVNFSRTRALMDCPIKIGGRLEGVVSVEYGDLPHDWTEDDQAFGASLADFAAIALTSARIAKATTLLDSLAARLPDAFYRRYTDYPLYTLEYISGRCDVLLGYKPDELICNSERRFFDLVHPEDLAKVKKAHEALLATREPLDVTYRLMHKNGDFRWIRDRGMMVEVRPDEPELSVVEGFLCDCAKQRQTSGEREARRAKKELMGEIGHDIHTPMKNILDLSKLLLETDLSPEQKKYAASIESGSEDLLRVITGLIGDSQAESAEAGLVCEDFSLKEMLRGLHEMYDGEFARKNLSFIMNVPVDFPDLVNGDRARLKRILMNLLSNALKFTQKGWVVLHCAHEYKNDRGRLRPLLTFQVADTGVGMDPRRFERISRSSGPVESSGKHHNDAGPGLTICHRLVRMMEGGLECESVLGQGSIFKARVILATAGDPAKPAAGSKYAKVEGGGYILLVEDSPSNQMAAKDILKEMGQPGDGVRRLPPPERNP